MLQSGNYSIGPSTEVVSFFCGMFIVKGFGQEMAPKSIGILNLPFLLDDFGHPAASLI